MNYTVYKTTNKINCKFYIGAHKTIDPNDRYLGSNEILNKAIKKYGRENFKKEILHFCSDEESMYIKEAEIVDKNFIKRKDTYNITEGGRGNSNLGNHVVENKLGIHSLSFDERSKISKTNQANRDPEERRAACSKGGKIGSKVGMERKSGIHGLSDKERQINSKKGIIEQKERKLGFFDSSLQSELGKRGQKVLQERGKRCWYNNGEKIFAYFENPNTIPFEQFLKENDQFSAGRLEVPYKPRPKQKGKVSLTNGKENKMIKSEEAELFLAKNPSWAFGRTNFKYKNK